MLVAMPVSCVLTYGRGWGIEGLWTGYGLSALCLSILYYTILSCINWEATAEWAAQNEEFSVSSSSNGMENNNNASMTMEKKFGLETPMLNRTLTSTSNELVETNSTQSSQTEIRALECFN